MLPTMHPKILRIVKWTALVILCGVVLYGAAISVASHTYWGRLFLETSDISIWRPIEHRNQYKASVTFIENRMLTPATSKFCSIGEAQFALNNDRYSNDYGRRAMLGWVDAQNAFSAMIRRHFIVVFKRDNPTVVEHVKWDTGETWNNTFD
jgi:hypothetical protein